MFFGIQLAFEAKHQSGAHATGTDRPHCGSYGDDAGGAGGDVSREQPNLHISP